MLKSKRCQVCHAEMSMGALYCAWCGDGQTTVLTRDCDAGMRDPDHAMKHDHVMADHTGPTPAPCEGCMDADHDPDEHFIPADCEPDNVAMVARDLANIMDRINRLQTVGEIDSAASYGAREHLRKATLCITY